MHHARLDVITPNSERATMSHNAKAENANHHTIHPSRITAPSQSQRILRGLLIAPDPLSTRLLLVTFIVVLLRVCILVLGDFQCAVCSLAGGPADSASELTDCWLERLVEDLADWVANCREEAWWEMDVRVEEVEAGSSLL